MKNQKVKATLPTALMRWWSSKSRGEKQRQKALCFDRLDLGLSRDFLGRILWYTTVKRKGQERQLVFKGHLLQTQEWSILRKSSKDDARLLQIIKEILKIHKNKKGSVEKLE